MAKIQLALDRLTVEQCVRIAEESAPFIHHIEIGTGTIKEYGMSVVREMRKRFLDKVIVADMKTCDAGKSEATQAFKAGADITTVMGYAANQTIVEMLAVAKDYDGRLMVDLIGITDPERVREIYELGVRMFNIHIGIDLQKDHGWGTHNFQVIKDLADIEIAVSGGINASTVPMLLKQGVDLLIIGGAITGQADPAMAAEKLQKEVREFAQDH